MRRSARANVTPIRQMTQFTCVSTSTCMALNALGVKCTEEQVNEIIGAKPMQGSRWEEVLACAQYFGCRATLTTPATLTQVKEWTDQGKPVLIAWNPEGRDWSHASLIFDVTGEKGNYIVHIADPNIPNPDKTIREVCEDEFYSKWFEKWPNFLVRRPALMIDREITPEGRQVMASSIVGNAGADKVRFQGRKLSLSTVKSYASDPDSPFHDKAKSFLKKRDKEDKNKTTETWLDKKMDMNDKKYRKVFDTRKNLVGKVIHFPLDILKDVTKNLSRKIPKPSVAFSKGFSEFANPTEENTNSMKENISYAVGEMFKGRLKKGEEHKVSECLVKAKKGAMEALGEASKSLLDQTARFGVSTMTGLMYAGLSASGKAVAGGAWAVLTVPEIFANLFQLNELDRVRVGAKVDPEKVLEEALSSVFNVFGKDEAKAIGKFIDEKGVFDQKGYMKEVKNMIRDIERNSKDFVRKLNEEAKKKSASQITRRYLSGQYLR